MEEIQNLYPINISEKSLHEIQFSKYTLGFQVETLGDCEEICHIPLQINTEALYSGVSAQDCILELISKIKSFIPNNVTTIKKPDEDYKDSENPNFQSIYLMMEDVYTSDFGLLIPNIYIKSYEDWQAILVEILKDKAMNIIQI